jgi:hypothetical protein
MLELNLPACPICQAQNSLSVETIDRAGKPYSWYQCQECGSVLLWLDDDRWAYQKIGRQDQEHLLKQPLTAVELHYLVDVPDELLAAPEQSYLVEVPDEPLAAPAPSVLAVSTEELDVAPGPPAPVPQKERKGPSRWLIIALAMIGLCFVLAVAGLLAVNQLGYW